MATEEDQIATLDQGKAELDASVDQRKARYDAEDAATKQARQLDDDRHAEGVTAYETKRAELQKTIDERGATDAGKIDSLHARVAELEANATAPAPEPASDDTGKSSKKSSS